MDGPTAAKENDLPSEASKLERRADSRIAKGATLWIAIMRSSANSIFIAMPQTDPGSGAHSPYALCPAHLSDNCQTDVLPERYCDPKSLSTSRNAICCPRS
jgi:hypothetical protein